MRTFLLLSVVAWAPAVEVVRDEWFVGTLGGAPSATLHQRVERIDASRVAVIGETSVVIVRNLGTQQVRIEVRDRQRLVEDAAGRLLEGFFEHDEGAGPIVAQGRIEGGRLRGHVMALGRTWPVDRVLAPGFDPRGDLWFQERLGQGGSVSLTAGSMTLLSNQLVPVATTATPKGSEKGGFRWDLLMDVAPVPMAVVMAEGGRLQRMTMSLGPMSIVFVPSDGPVPLVPADLSPAGLVKAAGPVPASRGQNRLRLPEGVRLPDNPFQRCEGEVVVIADAPAPVLPQSEDRATTPLCEADDPALMAWATQQVTGIEDLAERAERLRRAVRAHITKKDLSVAEGSAVQTLRNRQGDCSEHATLLAAALRAQGIPARITVGLVYSAPHGGWVGHAWTEAYVSGSWTLLDAAYPGLARCQYLALGTAGDQGANGALAGVLAGLLGRTLTVVK